MNQNQPPTRKSSRQRSSTDKQEVSHHPNKNPNTPPIDASTVPTIALKRAFADMKSHHLLFNRLDFVRVDERKLQQLFYSDASHRDRCFDKQGNFVHPPLALRRSSTQIINFLRLGILQKYEQIEKYQHYTIDDANLISYANSSFSMELPAINANPPSPPPPPVTKNPPPSESSTKSSPNTCTGVSVMSIYDMRYDKERRDEVLLGFAQTVREGWTTRQRLENPSNTGFVWPFEPPVVSCLTDGVDANKIIWKIEEHVGNTIINSQMPDFSRFHIKHVDCVNSEVPDGATLCQCCKSKLRQLQRRFDSNIQRRSQGFHPNMPLSFDRTISLSHERAGYWSKVAQKYSRKLSYREKALKKLLEETGVEVAINEHTDKIFDTKVADNIANFLGSDPNDKNAAIAEYVFREACQKYKQAKSHGRTSISHSALVIRLGIAVYKKMGYAGGMYDLLARCAGLPTARNLRYYTSSASSVPFGVIPDNLDVARQSFDEQHPNCESLDMRRACVLSWDEMHTKGKFNFNHHTGELIGVSQDCFDRGVIASEFSVLDPKSSDDDIAEKDIVVPEPCKHYLAFIATTLSTGTRKQHIFAARYNLKNGTPEFIAKRLLELPAILFDYGFVVIWLGNDGANENRTASSLLANISAKEILLQHYSADELKGLPIDFNIAYQHPSPGCEDIKIMIGSDMPHWVKKFRNAFDNKKKKLTFRGKRMSLQMIFAIWNTTISAGSELRLNHLSIDHFHLDSYKKMTVWRAVQITSQTTIMMIKDCCEQTNNNFDIDNYQPMIDLFDKVDRLIDICNSYDENQITKSGRRRNVRKLNHPTHDHVRELFEVLKLFEQWRLECGGYNNKFITWQTYQDLKWLVFGIAAVAALYLKDDKSITIDIGRGGSDVNEHLFSAIRDKNSNPDARQTDEVAGKYACANAVLDNNQFKNKAGSNTAGADVDLNAYVAPLPKKQKRN